MGILEAIEKHKVSFGLELGPEAATALERYYQVLQEHNELLHLVAPMNAEEFAIRHLLESLTMLKYLPAGTRFADVGSGGGLPAIPCLLIRKDLRAVLIESKEKKAQFLRTACETLGLASRTVVANNQFLETDLSGCSAVSCRALDKFTEKLPRLLKWSMRRKLLLFGGENLKNALQDNRVKFTQELMPMSEQRYLFISSTA